MRGAPNIGDGRSILSGGEARVAPRCGQRAVYVHKMVVVVKSRALWPARSSSAPPLPGYCLGFPLPSISFGTYLQQVLAKRSRDYGRCKCHYEFVEHLRLNRP